MKLTNLVTKNSPVPAYNSTNKRPGGARVARYPTVPSACSSSPSSGKTPAGLRIVHAFTGESSHLRVTVILAETHSGYDLGLPLNGPR